LARFTGLLGLIVFIGIAYAFSTNRHAIRWRTVAWGLGLQFLFAFIVLDSSLGQRFLAAAGSVSRLLDIPGLAEHGLGFKTIGQALYLRDLVLWRMERANDEPDAAARRALLNFVVVGAGYAGTEVVAQMARMTSWLADRFPGIGAGEVRWTLLDMAAKSCRNSAAISASAIRVLRSRGVDVRLRASVDRLTAAGAHLTDGSFLAGAAVVWCAGVTPNPIVSATGLPTVAGRPAVGTDLRVNGRAGIYAVGDAAAVPDVTKPRSPDGTRPLCPPTAQHAMRQGRAVAHAIVADVTGGRAKPYRHRGLGLVVDLGGRQAVARPLGVPLTGAFAKAVTRSYHLAALPTGRRRLQALVGWVLAGGTPDDVSFGLPMTASVLASAEHRDTKPVRTDPVGET